MKDLSKLIQLHRPSLVETAIETLLTASSPLNPDITEEDLARILTGIYANIERDLKEKPSKNSEFYLTQYYKKTFQTSLKLKRDFQIQLALLGTARVVLNHFLIHSASETNEAFYRKFETLQKIFDYTVLFLSNWWGEVHREIRAADQKLIDELKIVKNDLQRQLNVIYQLIKESPAGVAACDQQLKVLHWNPMASRVTGFQPADILKRNISEIIYVKSRDLFLDKIQSGREWISNLHLNIQQKNGKHFPALVSVSKIKQPRPGNIFAIISFQDISSQVKMTSQIQKIDKLKAISRLTSAMMHDIRNPLNSIGLNAEILEELLGKRLPQMPADIDDILKKIQTQVHQLAQNLNHYLRYTHLTDLNMEPTEIKSQLTSLIHDMSYAASMKKITVKFHRPRQEYWIMADWLQLRRVINNLLQNAIDILEDSGCIQVRLFRRKTRLLITIRDNGPGIDAMQLKDIFEPFYTTKPTGEGLGLFIAREIVIAHHGRISVVSEPGEGTLFTISFPRLIR